MLENDNYPGIISKLSNALFSSGCLKFGTFEIKSGVSSPYYLDISWLLSSPSDFNCIVNIVFERIRQLMASERIDKLASIELKGALLLPSIANQLNLPSVVVRKAAKNYGLTGKIAGGKITTDEHLLLFDDVVSKGTSKLEGIKSLEEFGVQVEWIMVLVDREQGGKEALESLGYKVHTISKITELVNHLLQRPQISKEHGRIVLDYVKKAKSTRETLI